MAWQGEVKLIKVMKRIAHMKICAILYSRRKEQKNVNYSKTAKNDRH